MGCRPGSTGRRTGGRKGQYKKKDSIKIGAAGKRYYCISRLSSFLGIFGSFSIVIWQRFVGLALTFLIKLGIISFND